MAKVPVAEEVKIDLGSLGIGAVTTDQMTDDDIRKLNAILNNAAFDSPEFKNATLALKTVDADRLNMLISPRTQPVMVPGSYEEAEAYWTETGEIITFEGSPYHVVDKAVLEGVPFIIMEYRTYEESKWKFGRPWITLLAVTKQPVLDKGGIPRNRVVINEGGSGICDQMLSFIERYPGRRGGFKCPAGLRASHYEVELPVVENGGVKTDSTGAVVFEKKPATTYYIA